MSPLLLKKNVSDAAELSSKDAEVQRLKESLDSSEVAHQKLSVEATVWISMKY
jgi:hypothetical protein